MRGVNALPVLMRPGVLPHPPSHLSHHHPNLPIPHTLPLTYLPPFPHPLHLFDTSLIFPLPHDTRTSDYTPYTTVQTDSPVPACLAPAPAPFLSPPDRARALLEHIVINWLTLAPPAC